VELGWSQGADARDAEGAPARSCAGDARAWSILGALIAASGSAPGAVYGRPVEAIARAAIALGQAADTGSLQEWNDAPGRTQAEVLAVFDSALLSLAPTADARPAAGSG
jgi:hypothetical protein